MTRSTAQHLPVISSTPSYHPASGNRRTFLADLGMGFTGLALGSMLARDGVAGHRAPGGQPDFAPKAKSVIWLFMTGGVSHMESFDPKPALNKYGGLHALEDALERCLMIRRLSKRTSVRCRTTIRPHLSTIKFIRCKSVIANGGKAESR